MLSMKYSIKKNTATEKLNRHWEFGIGAANPIAAMKTDFLEQLKYYKDEIGADYVRLGGTFTDSRTQTIFSLSDLYDIPNARKFVTRTFRLCGEAYDCILRVGVKPVVILGRIPKALAFKGALPNMFGEYACMPESMEDWCEYVVSYFEFLYHRYGKEEVRTWFFEFWNEPDLPIPMFSGTQEDYFHFYEATARAIKGFDSELKIGGPVTSNSKWIGTFVKYCKEHDVPVDFISTHQYAGDPLGGVEGTTEEEDVIRMKNIKTELERQKEAQLIVEEKNQKMNDLLGTIPIGTPLEGYRAWMGDPSEDEDSVLNLFSYNAAVACRQSEGLPLYYTEWNINAFNTSYTNDTKKVAAYAIKNALAIEKSVTGSMFFFLTDLYTDKGMFPEEFCGCYGLLTKSGIPKPAFYAFKMLRQAGDDRYVLKNEDGTDMILNDIGIAAFKKDKDVQVVVTRQKVKDSDALAENVEIAVEFEKVPSRVTIQRIDDTHCNPLALWEKMGSPQFPNAAEVKDIRKKTAMVEEALSFVYEDGQVQVAAGLKVNDVAMITIYA
ncbi:hypothetical protein DWZ56_01450 [Lachnotalea sp. AF33-28]|nr:hypothetical protein DWZ56_01450 [Lachnotalea sp. AF33-28]